MLGERSLYHLGEKKHNILFEFKTASELKIVVEISTRQFEANSILDKMQREMSCENSGGT